MDMNIDKEAVKNTTAAAYRETKSFAGKAYNFAVIDIKAMFSSECFEGCKTPASRARLWWVVVAVGVMAIIF